MSITTDQLVAAYAAMTDEDKKRIDRLAEHMIQRVKARRRGPAGTPFSRGQALELLAALGMFMVKRGQVVK